MVVEWHWFLFIAKWIFFLKENLQHKSKNRAGKRKGTKEKRESEAEGDAQPGVPESMDVPSPPRAAHGGGCPNFSSLLHRLLILALGICYDVSVMGHFGPS